MSEIVAHTQVKGKIHYFETYVCDFETITKNTKYYQTYKQGRINLWCAFNMFSEQHTLGVDMESFEEFIESRTLDTRMFFHNLSRFDAWVIINWARKHWNSDVVNNGSKIRFSLSQNGTRVLAIYIWNSNDVLIKITDSIRLLLLSVEALGNIYGFPKGTVDTYDVEPVDSLEEMDPNFIEYCKRDCEIVARGLKDLAKAIKDLNNRFEIEVSWDALTLGSISRKIVSSLDHFKEMKIPANYIHENKGYYRGGYTNFNQKARHRVIDKKLILCDAKSFYPSQIFKYEMPSGRPVWFSDINEKDKYKIVFVHVVGVIEEFNGCWAVIPKNTLEDHYQTDPGPFEFKGTWEEWEQVQKFYKFSTFKYVEFYGWEATNTILKGVVEFLYEKKENDKNSLMFKLILNAMYGSLAMRAKYPEIYYIKGDAPNNFKVRKKTYSLLCKKVLSIYEGWDAYDYLEDGDSGLAWNKWVSSYITSRARAELFEYLAVDMENNYYCDTDSILMSQESKTFTALNKGKYLGNWDIDKDDITTTFIQGPKRYLLSRAEKIVKTAFAGVNKKVLKDIDFEKALNLMTSDIIEGGQSRVELDIDLFPFIEYNNYNNKLNKGVLNVKKDIKRG